MDEYLDEKALNAIRRIVKPGDLDVEIIYKKETSKGITWIIIFSETVEDVIYEVCYSSEKRYWYIYSYKEANLEDSYRELGVISFDEIEVYQDGDVTCYMPNEKYKERYCKEN